MSKKFLQLIITFLDSDFWELHWYACSMYGPMKFPKLTPTPSNRTLDPMIARQTLYLKTTDTKD